MPAVTNRITIVRISVARFELRPATPSLPRMAVSPAKNAEPSANRSQGASAFMSSPVVAEVENGTAGARPRGSILPACTLAPARGHPLPQDGAMLFRSGTTRLACAWRALWDTLAAPDQASGISRNTHIPTRIQGSVTALKVFVSARLVAVAAVTFAITAAWPVTAATTVENSKLDAALSTVAQQGIGKTLDPKLLRIEPGQPEPLVQTILRYDGSLDAVRAEGAVIRSLIGNIATVDIPASKLAAVAALPSVLSIEAARSQPVRLDVSVPATRADALRTGTAPNWTGGSGKGVIVGIADTGVDFRHLDFRKTDGTTRILGLFDQRASGAAGSPPAPYTYGGECTPAMINSAIAGDPSACTQRDTHGHGTHVAGIAAGNGQATGNGQLAYRMIGMAPDADLLVANPPGTGLVTSNVLDAIAYMKAKAQALGKPLVVNMSFGSYFGARDGTSNYQQALDNLAGAGVILVAAAGNEANVPIRASGTITQGGSSSVNFNVPATDSSGAPFAFGQLEIWYPGSNSYGVNVAGPGCAATVTVNPGDAPGTLQTPCGGVEIASTGPNPNNDDRQILVRIGTTTASPLVPGPWTITLVGNVVAGGSSPFSILSLIHISEPTRRTP